MPNPLIARRRVRIAFEPDFLITWVPTTCALSFFFPAAEAYFVNSVRNYVEVIRDPILKQQAELFIYQEAPTPPNTPAPTGS